MFEPRQQEGMQQAQRHNFLDWLLLVLLWFAAPAIG